MSAFRLLLCLGLLSQCFAATRKNVLFLMADDFRPELGCYDGQDAPCPVHPPIHTPNIDALAAKSLLLKRAYVQQAICSPSRASLLTGRRPDTTHVYNLDDYFRKVGGNLTTIPQHFKNNGYVSAGLGKIFHPGKSNGHDDPPSWSEPYYHGHNYGWEPHDRSWHAIPDAQLHNKPLQDTQVANHAKTMLQKFAKGGQYQDRPFFLAVGFHKPHLPFVFPASFLNYYPRDQVHVPDNQYAPIGMPDVAWFHSNELLTGYQDIASLHASGNINTTLPPDQVIDLRRGYYSAVSYMDSLVGVVLDELARLGLEQNTIVSFLGDHGWQLGEHGLWCKHTNFELATHAPLMIRIPGKTDAGIETRKMVEFVDLFPTLVEAAGLTPLPLCGVHSSREPLCREGRSMMPLIDDPQLDGWKYAAFSQYPRHGGNPPRVMGYTVRNHYYRYTEWARFHGAPTYRPNWSSLVGVELYDHLADPEENRNLAEDPAHASARHQMQRLLRAGWRAATRETAAPHIIG